MTTIVVHGTMTWQGAAHYAWWWNSWGGSGFLQAVSHGMMEVSGYHDVWRIGGRPVSDFPELQSRRLAQHDGYFRWSGADTPAARDAGASQLVDYLNTLVGLSDEPLRIIAHSHGCNLVKKASSQRNLLSNVFIDRAVFLACPHFAAQSGNRLSFPYRLNPNRFGAILGLACKDDPVQIEIAGSVHGGLEIHGWDISGIASRSYPMDRDPEAQRLYENYFLPTEAKGKERHSVIHGATAGYLVGQWLQGHDRLAGGQRVSVIPDKDEGGG